jgi:hypothetical protein
LLIAAVADKRLQTRMILFDTWYASADHLKTVAQRCLETALE